MSQIKERKTNKKGKKDCSFANNIQYTKLERTSLEEILDTIKINDELKDKIDKLRASKDPSDKSNIKNKLPYFILGTFKNNIRKKDNLESTRFMILDIDKQDSEKLTKLKSKLEKDKRIVSYFTSPSGDGVKIIYKFNRLIKDPVEFTKVYNHFANIFHEEYLIKPDSTNDASRACYFSYDPKIYRNPKATLSRIPSEISENNNTNKTSNKTSSNYKKKQETKQNSYNNDRETKYFSRNQTVKLKDGTSVSAFSIESKTEIFCPFCIHDNEHRKNPNRPNAFIDLNNDGYYYISCSSEHITYWEEGSVLGGIFERGNNSYGKIKKIDGDYVGVRLTSFVIEPRELLVLKDSDTLKCDVKTVRGNTYTNVLLENKDWHSKSKLLSAIGHQDCVFLGSDNDVQMLCDVINQKVPVRKAGTKTIGLHDDKWVIEDKNITADGELIVPEIIPNEKGAESFHNKIWYPSITDNEPQELINGFYENIFKINRVETILPFVAWGFITPLKPKILEYLDGFPHLFVHGAQGSGKTSTALMMMRLWGYKTSGTFSCTLNPFPMLKLMSSTNAIPLVFDEFKKQDLTQYQMNNIHRMMRKSYSNEIETRGKPDQTTVDYHLTAPMAVMGEWNTNQPAIRERIIVSSFNNIVKENQNMQNSFHNLKQLQLESFMNNYIPFILRQDVKKLLDKSKNEIDKKFQGYSIAPRVISNLSIMYGGYLLFRRFAEENSITVQPIDMDKVLEFQLSEITGSNTGQVESAVDQLIEGFATMVAGGFDISESYDYKKMTDRDGVEGIAINLKVFMPKFKEWARKTSYEIEILDHKSYSKLFDDTNYIKSKDKTVNFRGTPKRCLFIDIDKAEKAGVDLEGFVNPKLTEEEQLQANRESFL